MGDTEYEKENRQGEGEPKRGGIRSETEQWFHRFPDSQRENKGESQDVQGRQQDQPAGARGMSGRTGEECRHDEAQVQNEDRIEGVDLFSCAHEGQQHRDPQGIENKRLQQSSGG